MKNGRVLLAILLACLFLLSAMPRLFAQANNGTFDLALTEIEAQPFGAGIGDETHYAVTLESLHTTPLPPELFLDLLLTVTNAQSEETIAQCRQPVDFSLFSAEHYAVRIPLNDCAVVLQNSGTHLVRAELVKMGQAAQEDAFALIPGDLNQGNNGTFTTVVPVVSDGDSSLPIELTRIFAGLAIFFAVMALVAAGAEVAIDSLKVAIGLKRKVTSMEALERMEKYLPGELGALSVSAATQEEFRRMIREMRASLAKTLQRVESFVAVRDQITGSEFGSSFQRASDLCPSQEAPPLSEKALYNYKKFLQSYVTTILNTLENRLHLSSTSIRPFRDQLAQEISQFSGNEPIHFMEDLVRELQNPNFWSSQIVDGWLSSKQEALYVRNSSVVIDEFDGELRPVLLGIGFSAQSIDSLKQELVSRLGIVESGMSQSTDTFLDSIRNVLDAVELRRYDTQSPSRKAWRKLRSWQGGSFPPSRLRSTIMPAVYLALFLLYLARLMGITDSAPLGGSLQRIFGALNNLPWISWFILLFFLALSAVLGLYFLLAATGSQERLWFRGLYGASALATLGGLVVTLLLWILQPLSINRVTGDLVFFGRLQPWWSWLIIFSLALLLLLLVLSLVGKALYDRLVRSAIRDGRLIVNTHALDDATVIHRVETLWNLLRQGFDVTRVDPTNFSKADTVADYESAFHASESTSFVFSPETAARFIMQRTDQQRDEESSRLRILRVLSIIIGLLIAYTLQIDVLQMLGESFPDVMGQLNWTIVSGQTLHAWRTWLPADKSITVGIVLTAFAASAGSAFWHDRLDQLQASKKGAQAAAQLLSQASQVADSTKPES